MDRQFSDANLDRPWAAALAESYAEMYRDLTISWPADPALPSPVECALAADQALDTAMLTHALGADAAELRLWLLRAGGAFARLFAQPAGATPIEVRLLTSDGAAIDTLPPAEPDRSLTGAARGVLALQVALAAGDGELLGRLAHLIDGRTAPSRPAAPSEADEASHGLAVGLAAWLRGETVVAVFHLGGLLDDAQPLETRTQARALLALIDGRSGPVTRAIDELLAAHAERAADPQQRREPRWLLCLPAQALAALAYRVGMPAGAAALSASPHALYARADLIPLATSSDPEAPR
jgi:hypothetical protein